MINPEICPYCVQYARGEGRTNADFGDLLSAELESVGIKATADCNNLWLTVTTKPYNWQAPLRTRHIFEPLGISAANLAELTERFVNSRVAFFVEKVTQIRTNEIFVPRHFRIPCYEFDEGRIFFTVNQILYDSPLGVEAELDCTVNCRYFHFRERSE